MIQYRKSSASKKNFLLALSTLIIAVACASIDTRRNDAPVLLPEAIEIDKNGIRIAVYPQLELLSVIQLLSGYRYIIDEFMPGFNPDFELEYERIINARFADFREHEAVLFMYRYFPKGFNFCCPPKAALMINRDFTLDRAAFAASGNFQAFYDIIDEFVSLMKSFYLESDFETFFLSQAYFYAAILEQVAGVFPDWDMISVMESFFGKNLESYNVALVPLYANHGFGPSIMRENGLAIYSIQGPFGVDGNGYPWFGDTENFTHLALHEFGHSFLDFNNSDNIHIRRALEDSEYLMDPIREQMLMQAYGHWNYAAEELILRAIVIRMLADNIGIDVEEHLGKEYNRGFIYIHTVYDLLQLYIDNRETYPVFDDFIPFLIGELMRIYPRP